MQIWKDYYGMVLNPLIHIGFWSLCIYICLSVCIYIRGIVPPNLLSQSISSINIHIPISPKPALIPIQGLIQKEKVDTDGEKSAQISIVVKKTVTQRWLQIMIMEPKQANITIIWYFFWYYVCVMLLIWSKNWNYVYW